MNIWCPMHAKAALPHTCIMYYACIFMVYHLTGHRPFCNVALPANGCMLLLGCNSLVQLVTFQVHSHPIHKILDIAISRTIESLV